jgi:hypothetical protein
MLFSAGLRRPQAAAARLKPPKYAGIEVRVGIWTQVSSHGPPRTRDLERDDLSVELLSLFHQTGHYENALAFVATTETSPLGRQRSCAARTQHVRLTWLWGAAGGLRDLQSETRVSVGSGPALSKMRSLALSRLALRLVVPNPFDIRFDTRLRLDRNDFACVAHEGNDRQ